MLRSLGFWLAHLCIVGICAVLLGAFSVQFIEGEFPCPLCLLQRMAMMLCALGPAYVILKTRQGDVSSTDFCTGYGLSVLAGLGGALISARQVLLHIVPPDPGFGEPMFGLHLYTWALVVFGTVIVVSGLNLVFNAELAPRGVKFGWPSRLVIGLLAAVILANVIAVFCQEGLHWSIPDSPDRYQLFEDLGIGGTHEAPAK
jgi:disulfide bond formation protein DsbB